MKFSQIQNEDPGRLFLLDGLKKSWSNYGQRGLLQLVLRPEALQVRHGRRGEFLVRGVRGQLFDLASSLRHVRMNFFWRFANLKSRGGCKLLIGVAQSSVSIRSILHKLCRTCRERESTLTYSVEKTDIGKNNEETEERT